MKNFYVKAFCVGFALICLNGVLNNCSEAPVRKDNTSLTNSIIILPGYSFAVAICGPAEEGYSDAIVVKRGNYTLYINSGYIYDTEIDQLSELATKKCKRLK